MKIRYKFINFVDIKGLNNGYAIHNNKNMEVIGYIEWFEGWESWCLTTIDQCVFSPSCLQDIIDFIKQLK